MYLCIRVLEVTLVLNSSSWHKSRVFFHAHKVHFPHIFAKELEIVEIAEQYRQDIQGPIHDVKLLIVENTHSSNSELPMLNKSEQHKLPQVLDTDSVGFQMVFCCSL